ncbi:hypothetical protein SAMN05216503_3339 [Polaribacter sp. KT25b]|uniref:hypothetical protein n=1 Tax=Polaribacter sp. KT25b TaxID=1855336 RepID=UPI00087BCB74|nr:hypothetical protein [Polaribacter sp. KT25b]SDS52503.1 hypothetical protein SAMN05216503_3339 [Polaribacter sp. KT25b]
MKKLILLIILFSAFAAEAQYGNGYGSQQRRRQSDMMQTQEKAPEPNFEIEKYLGIVIYNIEKAAKKTKIKLSSKEGKLFSKALTEYNKDIKDITRINSFLLRSTKETVENFQKVSAKSGDFSNRTEVIKTMNDNLKPISNTLKKEDIKLDATMKSILSEKQYKKWIKYNRKLYKIFPKEGEEEE